MDPLTIGLLVAGFVFFKKPVTAAAPNASPDAGPQAVDVGNPIAGAPVFNLAGALAGRHQGVDNTGPSLNPSTSSTGPTTPPATAATTTGNLNIWNGGVQVPAAGPYYDAPINQRASGGFNSVGFGQLGYADFLTQSPDVSFITGIADDIKNLFFR